MMQGDYSSLDRPSHCGDDSRSLDRVHNRSKILEEENSNQN
jgi:hypothetical protein